MKLIIAGGGTGGHLFSGLAVAEEWVLRGGEVLFVGTPKGLENKLIPERGYRLELIQVSTIKGSGLLQKLRTVFGLPRAFIRSCKLIKRERPQVVLGIGGYASGPMVLAARFKGIKTAIVDQNSIPGLTNRILGKWVHRIFLTFEEASTYFSAKKIKVTGNPVVKERRGFEVIPKKERPVILVCGGSQGGSQD